MALFKKKASAAITGHAGDDQLLSLLAQQHGPLGKPRHWVHYLYVADEQAATDRPITMPVGGELPGWAPSGRWFAVPVPRLKCADDVTFHDNAGRLVPDHNFGS